MNTIKYISEIADICSSSNTSASCISISPRKNSNPIVVFIYKDNPSIESYTISGIHAYHLTESDILSKILEKDAILTKLFCNAITIKDDLHIMPIIMHSLLALRLDDKMSPHIGNPRDLIVTFHNVSTPELFVKNIFIPFMRKTKYFFNKCRFILKYHEQDNSKSVSVIFDCTGHHFSLSKFERLLISKFPEFNLHSLSISHPIGNIIKNDAITNILQQVSEKMILAYNENGDNDMIIKQVISHYIDIAIQVEPELQSFMNINYNIYESMLPQSISSISSRLTEHNHILNVQNKMSHEYDKLFHNNMTGLYSHIAPFVQNWNTQNMQIKLSKPICKTIKTTEIKETFLQEVYSGIFSSAMMHSYYKAFIPYSINEILTNLTKYEI